MLPEGLIYPKNWCLLYIGKNNIKPFLFQKLSDDKNYVI